MKAKTQKQNGIVVYDQHGKQTGFIELSEKDFDEMERAMQWPEDLEAYDRLRTPIQVGFGKNGLVFLN